MMGATKNHEKARYKEVSTEEEVDHGPQEAQAWPLLAWNSNPLHKTSTVQMAAANLSPRRTSAVRRSTSSALGRGVCTDLHEEIVFSSRITFFQQQTGVTSMAKKHKTHKVSKATKRSVRAFIKRAARKAGTTAAAIKRSLG
jgi:hypothetical protein